MKDFEEFVESILHEENGFEFGEPWRKSDKSLTVVVPILRKNAPERNYVTIDEVKDKVQVEDTGNIHRIRIVSNDSRPVFVRSGSIFKGEGTQSRGIVESTVLYPNEIKEVEARCVHASHPIRTRAKFSYVGVAPLSVRKNLVSGVSQPRVWASVNQVAGTDNLVAFMAAPSDAGTVSHRPQVSIPGPVAGVRRRISRRVDLSKVDRSIEDIPVLGDQAGVIILDMEGIVAFEVFDNPKSWVTFHSGILKDIDTEEPIFKMDEKAVETRVRRFLIGLVELRDFEVVDEGDRHKTFKFAFDRRYVGEFTKVDNQIIHIIVTRTEDLQEESGNSEINFVENIVGRVTGVLEYFADRTRTDTSTGSTTITDNSTNIDNSVRVYTIPGGFRDLSRRWSTRTFSKYAKALRDSGLIEKKGRSYVLTKNGHRILSKMEDLKEDLASTAKRALYRRLGEEEFKN